MYHSPNSLRQHTAGVGAAIRFGAVTVALGLGFLVVAAVWVSTCSGDTTDPLACGPPQRAVLALGAPAILLAGGLWAFLRTYQTRPRSHAWWAWQGAGGFLLVVTIPVLMVSLPPLAGQLG